MKACLEKVRRNGYWNVEMLVYNYVSLLVYINLLVYTNVSLHKFSEFRKNSEQLYRIIIVLAKIFINTNKIITSCSKIIVWAAKTNNCLLNMDF